MKILKIIIATAIFASLSSCQTVAGLGQDIQTGGSNLQKAAQPKL